MFCFRVQKQKEKLEYSLNRACLLHFQGFSPGYRPVQVLGGGENVYYPEAATSNKTSPGSGEGGNPCS